MLFSLSLLLRGRSPWVLPPIAPEDRLPTMRERQPYLPVGLMVLGALLAGPVQAQAALPPCQAPSPKEYLLLVVLQDNGAQEKLRQSLPPSVNAPTCDYLGSRVARMGGFSQVEDVNAWAKYLRDSAGLATFIARPPASAAPMAAAPPVPPVAVAPAPAAAPTAVPPMPTLTAAAFPNPTAAPPPTPPVPSIAAVDAVAMPASAPAAAATSLTPAPAAPAPPAVLSAAAPGPTVAFNPQPLTTSYAVLVDYTQQPAIARQLQTLLQQPIGLASYGQQPYLLAQATNDAALAAIALRTLSEKGYRAMIVDGRGVVVLTSQVKL